MASLKFREKNALEDFLEMGGGYVLNFSDRTFSTFFHDFDIDIDDPVYSEGHSGSKANRLRSFWDLAPNELVGQVLKELIQYAEDYRPGHIKVDTCIEISARLREPKASAGTPFEPAVEYQVPRMDVPEYPVEIFFSYAHEDKQLMNEVRLQLVVHERLGAIIKWHDRMIPAGDEWRAHIDHRIERAHVILLFMSPDFLASRYCYEIEGEVALRRHREGTARVIPIVLRACDWKVTPFGELQALPSDGIPVTQWPDRDQVSLNIARDIMNSITGTNGVDF